MPKSRSPYPSRAKLEAKASRLRDAFLADPQFQEALKEIRTRFHIPYPATPEEKESWYKQNFGALTESVLTRVIADAGPEYWHFVQEVGKYQEALSAKYGIPVRICFAKLHPFDIAVTDTLGFLGLPKEDSFRDFLIACLWGEQWIPIGPSGLGRLDSRVAGFSEFTLAFSTYDSLQEVYDLLSRQTEEWKARRKALKGRPTKVRNHSRLEQRILAVVQANQRQPKDQQVRHGALCTQLWQETREQGLHTLDKAGFTAFFYKTLRPLRLIKSYDKS